MSCEPSGHAVRMACPMTAQELQPTVQDVEQLRMFPCLDDNTIVGNLQEELPAYIAEIEDVQVRRGDEMVWWRRHKLSLPHWSSAAYNLALVQPSSAAAERVFSILRSHFDDHQAGALEDLEAAVMLAYNYRG